MKKCWFWIIWAGAWLLWCMLWGVVAVAKLPQHPVQESITAASFLVSAIVNIWVVAFWWRKLKAERIKRKNQWLTEWWRYIDE